MRGRGKAEGYQGVQARLVFPEREEAAVLDLMRRFSAAKRFAYNRLEGRTREELKRQDGPLCPRFRLNTRHADEAIEKVKRQHLSGKDWKRLQREWKEKRQGLYARGDGSKGGNLNLRLLVRTGHPHLDKLLERVHAGLPYNVGLSLREGQVQAHFTWPEGLPPPTHTKENGVLGIDVNSDPYHLALAVVSPDGNLVRHLTLSLEEVDSAPNKGAKELLLWKVAHQVVALAEGHGVAVATERLKHLRETHRGDGSGRAFRRRQHRFAYRALLQKIHALARKRGVEVLEVNPQDTSSIGMLKYAPLLSLSKDIAAAYVIGRSALGLTEKLPKGYGALLRDEGFHRARLRELQKLKETERNPCLKRRLSREMGKARRSLNLVQSLRGSPGSRSGSTEGRNPSGINPWRVLRVGLFLPFLGREVPRDLSPLKPFLHGLWERWKTGPGPHPGGEPECANVHFC